MYAWQAEREKGVGHLEDMVIKEAGGIVHDVIGRPVSFVDPEEAVPTPLNKPLHRCHFILPSPFIYKETWSSEQVGEDDDDLGHMSFAPRRNVVTSSCVLM